MRPMKDVRQAILNVIEDEDVRDALKGATDHVLDSVNYCAPEMVSQFWGEFGIAMRVVMTSEELHYPTADKTSWGKKTIDIFCGKLDYKDYL